MLLAAGILVMAAEPPRALAASARRTVPTHSSTPPVRPANPVLLAFGSDYGGGANAVAVRALQRRLGSVGASPGAIDGRYGPRTESSDAAVLESRAEAAIAVELGFRLLERGDAAANLGVLLERWNDPQGALWAYEQAQASGHPEIAEMARERALALSAGEEHKR